MGLEEESIISIFRNRFPAFIGDDAAILPLSDDDRYVISKDMLVEDVHFRLHYFEPDDLAFKALQVNLSDLAAMGVSGRYVILGLAIPRALSPAYVQDFCDAFANQCQEHGLVLVGGDTTRSPNTLVISVTVIGIAKAKSLKLRSLAQVGDIICVTGRLGYAHLGLLCCEQGLQSEEVDIFRNACLRPHAHISEGVWLGQQNAINAMMDISDGLYVDLTKMSRAAAKPMRLDVEELEKRISQDKGFTAVCSLMHKKPLEVCLSGGEEYCLLLTVKAQEYENLNISFEKIFGRKLTRVGRVERGIRGGVTICRNGKVINMALSLFSHFNEL